ncbi:MAG TPA: hypothetical protein DDW51_27975 [Cyanobacteria bacterium UBA11367]|nr:hypothetical protein [Cyanobacteria bacterium UBA11367]HBE58308.1 hypothetical protein [Cyanobacteria bacterium UBA11366]HBK65774.1 hypothetical protein [Cyanobacteria bacterium UBA11166]
MKQIFHKKSPLFYYLSSWQLTDILPQNLCALCANLCALCVKNNPPPETETWLYQKTRFLIKDSKPILALASNTNFLK